MLDTDWTDSKAEYCKFRVEAEEMHSFLASFKTI